MGVKGLIDTGAILALLNPRDRWHRACSEALKSLRLPLGTSAAVVAEIFHLLPEHPKNAEACWRFLRCGAVKLLPVTDEDMPGMERLMKKYRDRPMDFADATLVRLAQRESLSAIFTVDQADFQTYRISGRRRFNVFPPPGEGPAAL